MSIEARDLGAPEAGAVSGSELIRVSPGLKSTIWLLTTEPSFQFCF